MAKDNGTAEQVSGVYTHPEFPERSLERLQADAAKFNLDDHLVALFTTQRIKKRNF